MGTVYLARDPVLDRPVAVKVMTAGGEDAPDQLLRFRREAQAAGGLRHPNIVTVYDVGEDAGRPYIAMEYVEGTDLEHIIRAGGYSTEWALDVLRQMCEGLAYAHRAAIVHRDVKPANNRIGASGLVKIMDFGLARVASSTMTGSGRLLGTIHYMAPEQVEGGPVDSRADVFAVGAIGYELLARRRPFQGDSLTEVMFQIVHGAADSTALPVTPYSPGLEAVILKALARDPAARHQTLEALHGELASLVQEAARVVLEPRKA